MAFLGSLSYVLSVGSSLIGITFAILYFFKKESSYALLAIRSVYANAIFISIATLSLIVLLLSADFSVVYVANHVNHALPYFYRFTSVWAGQAGSLLWWNFLLSLFSAIALSDISKREAKLIPGMIIVLLLTSLFFTVLGSFTSDSDPFVQFVGKQGNKLFLLSQNDGRGLNPLLQHWAMIIHPPILYLGYVSFAVPFAIAMSVLMLKNIHIKWIPLVRRWTLFSWGFLGFGILLGGKWAYEELGWGGYWAWDPVENAALMPWLTGTAFLHSVIVQERRNMLKVWNMTLVTISFLMCIFGTFLTRSGVVSSVHAFASSNLGPFFTGFMALMAIFSLVLILSRYKELKSDKPIESFLSREAGFLFNNVILLIALLTVIWGTMYPVFTEAVYGEKTSVTAIWFNKWMSPLGLAILFLTGLGPLLSWRRTSANTLWRNLRFPLLAFLIISIGVFLYAKISLKENHFLASLS
ncbi:MAG: heme lyase CcmF/NrfE family subunit, partial [Candidatus Hydrogenedentota bacterium]